MDAARQRGNRAQPLPKYTQRERPRETPKGAAAGAPLEGCWRARGAVLYRAQFRGPGRPTAVQIHHACSAGSAGGSICRLLGRWWQPPSHPASSPGTE
ncbi:hypothetical protein MTO96_019877 [Rhipicephalus appendiculatus]